MKKQNKMKGNREGVKDGINLATGAVVHRGEYVKNIIRQLGIKITSVATAMNLSRNTLYNKFAEEELSTEFIHRIGQIIKYDFSKKIADVQAMGYVSEDSLSLFSKKSDTSKTEQKYIELLEKYNYVLELVTRISLKKTDEEAFIQLFSFLEKVSKEPKRPIPSKGQASPEN